MKLVFLMDDGPGNAWLIRELERDVAVQAIIRTDWNCLRPTSPEPPPRRTRSLHSLYRRLIWSVRQPYFYQPDRRAAAELTKLLFAGPSPPAPVTPVWSVPWWDINGEGTRDRLRSLAPDLMVVCGAPLLKPALYNLPRLGTVNLHFGISPNYRGIHTVLWPWRLGDYAHIGATLHYVNDGIDSGPVLFRVYPGLEPEDNLVSAEAKITRLATRALRDFLAWLATRPADAPPPGIPLAGPGLLIHSQDRSISGDLWLRFKEFSGVRPPRLPERVELFYTR